MKPESSEFQKQFENLTLSRGAYCQPESDVELLFGPLFTVFGLIFIAIGEHPWFKILGLVMLMIAGMMWLWVLHDIHEHPEKWKSVR